MRGASFSQGSIQQQLARWGGSAHLKSREGERERERSLRKRGSGLTSEKAGLRRARLPFHQETNYIHTLPSLYSFLPPRSSLLLTSLERRPSDVIRKQWKGRGAESGKCGRDRGSEGSNCAPRGKEGRSHTNTNMHSGKHRQNTPDIHDRLT